MSEVKKIPELRFPEFSIRWASFKLEELFGNISSGKSKKKEEGNFPLYGSTGIIGSVRSPEYEGNKLLVARVGANAGSLYVVNGKYGVSDNTLMINENDEKSLSFLYYQLLSFNLNRLIFGSGQPLITGGQLKSLRLPFPTIPEQQKIASFLSTVDTKIEQLNQKLTLLEQYKKGAMQQIFTQQIRFKDYNGNAYPEWEEKKIGKVLTIGSGKDYKHLDEGEIPVYGTGGLMTKVDEYLYDGESVCIGRKGTIDKPAFLTGKFWTVDTLFYTHSFIGCLPKFLFYTFNTINWKRYNEASGVPSLSKTTIEKIKIGLPSIEEQTKIANFLSAIDAKIELVNNQLENNQQFKKGLLQKMFV